MKYLEKIQGMLPLGYLYLMILGVLKEGALCYYLGINLISYSSITDILISPIADLSSDPKLLIAIAGMVSFLLIIQLLLVNYSHKSWAKKILGENRFNENSTKMEIQKFVFPFFMVLAGIQLFGFFVGIGMQEGKILSKRITSNEYKCNYSVNFSSGTVENIFIFHKNSGYYFYVTKGDKNIKIATAGTINKLELIDNEKLAR